MEAARIKTTLEGGIDKGKSGYSLGTLRWAVCTTCTQGTHVQGSQPCELPVLSGVLPHNVSDYSGRVVSISVLACVTALVIHGSGIATLLCSVKAQALHSLKYIFGDFK